MDVLMIFIQNFMTRNRLCKSMTLNARLLQHLFEGSIANLVIVSIISWLYYFHFYVPHVPAYFSAK